MTQPSDLSGTSRRDGYPLVHGLCGADRVERIARPGMRAMDAGVLRIMQGRLRSAPPA